MDMPDFKDLAWSQLVLNTHRSLGLMDWGVFKEVPQEATVWTRVTETTSQGSLSELVDALEDIGAYW